ncbi:MAG TPA: peptidase [Flavobacteriales bacterium]|nr:peptidase [Flavobacteriales bacterium]HIO68509.1 peptidase [Flavobacteriales bacterium]
MKNNIFIVLLSTLIACGVNTENKETDKALDKEALSKFLTEYNAEYQRLLTIASEAEWKLNTYIVEGDTVSGNAASAANQQMVDFTGSEENIEHAMGFLEYDSLLNNLERRQLNNILYKAGGAPAIAGEVVSKKIEADTKQTQDLYGFQFMIGLDSVTPNDIVNLLKSENNEAKRLEAWTASKEVGKDLKDGLVNLRNLRNQSVQALNYEDYFHYQVSEYGMTTQEMIDLCRGMTQDIWPLYRELHTWARYTLAAKYSAEVPTLLPAHWLPNRWGQDWTGLVNVEGLDLDPILKEKGNEWIVKKGEDFYMSLGFPALPATFYEKSSLYALPAGADYKKNNHASAWHIDNDKDVRSLMSIEANTEWWETTLHELGHIYYFMTYSNDDVPIILREGANRAYHEAMGTLMGLASLQKPFLVNLELMEEGIATDETQALLKEALNYIVLIPWGAGVMTEFEKSIYSDNLPPDQFNKRWWEIKQNVQGIAPPSERGEEYCDAASKTHINNDAAQYYDYAISNILLFQVHEHIANKILKQDPHATNYYGSKEIGEFLTDLMYPGASVDWREHLQASIGQELSARAMVNYFQPLMKYLKKENKNREHTLPESPQY